MALKSKTKLLETVGAAVAFLVLYLVLVTVILLVLQAVILHGHK
jgi:hypothetical protein